MIEIVPASVLHVKPMAAVMRSGSAMALQAFGFSPRRSLMRALLGSFYARTALEDGKPVAMWGAHGLVLGEMAEPWLTVSTSITKMPIAIVRAARRELQVMMQNRSLVIAMIPGDDIAVRFAVYLGFTDRQGGTRHEMERRIMNDPSRRVSYGDRYVVPMIYNARCH